jgi:hypothetical protein
VCGDVGHGIGRCVLALVFVRSSFTELPITHKALSRHVVALIIGVKTLKKVVAAVKELAQHPQVIEPREISTSPTIAVLLRADA